MKRKLKVNDFFCGCGGMGIAFKNAGYEIAGAWDFDKYAVETYRANVGDHVQKADIKEPSRYTTSGCMGVWFSLPGFELCRKAKGYDFKMRGLRRGSRN